MLGQSRADSTREEPVIVRSAFVSTYPPRQCGIATFTHNLSSAMGDREIVALHPHEEPLPYPLEVRHRIHRDDRSDYAPTARSLGDCVDVVSIQHEFGIHGGPDGREVLDLVDGLDVPVATTLHTILDRPGVSGRSSSGSSRRRPARW